jgi:hypothetical protein
MVALQISSLSVDAAARTFPAYPQTLSSLCGRAWLACGSAAMTFDPLCGEGAGHAARQALLAAAILRASMRGEQSANLLAHYSNRLLHGFLRHLQVCLPYYRTGGPSHFWKNEAASLECGIRWLQNRLRGREAFQYRFSGYDLEPIAEVLPVS